MESQETSFDWRCVPSAVPWSQLDTGEHPWGPEQTAGDHPAEARGSPPGRCSFVDGERIPKDLELMLRGIQACGKGRTENAQGGVSGME